MVTATLNNRYKASLFHFLISLSIFSVFIFVLLNFWYPTPFFTASGGWQGLKIVAMIDLVVGPVLTLVVYNIQKSKQELLFDFSLIALLQVAALIWGVHTVYDQRPIAAVFWDNGFYTVPATALDKQNIKLESLTKFGPEKPYYIFAQNPQNEDARLEMLENIIEKKIPPYQQVSLYKPVSENYNKIYKHKLNIEEITSTNPDMKAEISAILESSNTKMDDNYYIALISKYRNIVLVFNKQNELLGTASAPFKNKV